MQNMAIQHITSGKSSNITVIKSSDNPEAIGDSLSASLIILMVVVWDGAAVASLLRSTVGCDVLDDWMFVG